MICRLLCLISVFVFFKQKTAYEMRISDWSSDVCSSDLLGTAKVEKARRRDPRTVDRHAVRNDRHRLFEADRRRRGADPADRDRTAAQPDGAADNKAEIGRESCRDRVCPYV